MDANTTRRVIEGELNGAQVDDVFEWIDLQNVLGSASIAQVVTASLLMPLKSPTMQLVLCTYDTN